MLCDKHASKQGECAGCKLVFTSDDYLMQHLEGAREQMADCARGIFPQQIKVAR